MHKPFLLHGGMSVFARILPFISGKSAGKNNAALYFIPYQLMLITFFLLNSLETYPSNGAGPISVNAAVIYPKIRIWTSPSAGEEPAFNPPSFQWPSKKNGKYSIRISSSKDFNSNLIEQTGLPYAVYNPHKRLNTGKWYWQYKVNDEKWNKADSLMIKSSTRLFVTPDIKKILAGISPSHPRVLLKSEDLPVFRRKAKTYRESGLIILEANGYLTKPVPKEASALPSFKGNDDFENGKIASLSSKWAGRNIQKAIISLSQAYLLTGDEKYFYSARTWMMEVSGWDPNGPTHTNNFGDAGIMSALAIGVDTFWDLLTNTERDQIIHHATIRASQFYKLWIGQVESRSSSMHVWQHILHNLLQTSLAFKGEIPEADLWCEYIYELWIAQSPKMGEEDGAWFNGTSYFGMNMLTLVDVSMIFKELSGVNFLESEWFKNNPRWLIYSFPPGSVSDGFCNDGERYAFPAINYGGYCDAIARLLNNPYAAWYAQAVTKSLGKEIADDDEFRWFRIQRGLALNLPEPVREDDLPQAAAFTDIGVAYMHTALHLGKTDLMLSLRSAPFGPMGHAHADQNTFNIAYGGKRLFYNTGYRPAMGDPHFLGWYKHTRGHNGILIDGEGQPFSDEAYGYLPRFLHGKQISYAVGDASRAWSGTDEGVKTDRGMTLFRRHYLMLRPSTIVIYDELEANHPASWSWLLHNDNGLMIDAEKKMIFAESKVAKAQVSLYSSSEIEFRVTDQFSVPVDNWTNKINEEGDTLVFRNQWHFSGISKQKTLKMRYLAIFQVNADGSFERIISNENKIFTVGAWEIKAEMNALKPATIQVANKDQSAILVSDGILTSRHKIYKGMDLGNSKLVEQIDGKAVFQETADRIPVAMQKAMMKN